MDHNAAYDSNSIVYEDADQELTQQMQAYLVRPAPKRYFYIFAKRFFDIILSALALIVLAPVFFVIFMFIKQDSPGPVFFVHTRIGKNHKRIKVYKFRTMVDRAEEEIQNFTTKQQREYERNFKLENDPRITRIGKFLRKTSLDELPQLVNIFFGDLSIVGPRPVVEQELSKYGDSTERLLSVKPGLTGYWQVHGRSNTTYEQRIEMDMKYIENRSLRLDLGIILRTIPAVLRRNGAY